MEALPLEPVLALPPLDTAADDRRCADRSAARASMTDADAARVSAGVRRGEQAALGALYEAWFDRCYALARGWTRRDESFCLDVVQETMLRAIRGLKPLPHARALDAWMHAAARSATIDAIRRETRRVARERIAGESTGPRERHASDLDDLALALQALRPDAAADLRERFQFDRTLAEIAACRRGETPGSAHGRIRRALATLKSLLTREDR